MELIMKSESIAISERQKFELTFNEYKSKYSKLDLNFISLSGDYGLKCKRLAELESELEKLKANSTKNLVTREYMTKEINDALT